MIPNTTNIKNLAIALEAISRINNEGSADFYVRVEDLLKGALTNLEIRTNEMLPSASTPPTTPPTKAPTLDDEIPF